MDDNGEPQRVIGNASITLTVETTADGTGNLTAMTGSATGTGQGQASNSQIDEYGVSCYSRVNSGHSHSLGGATTDNFEVIGHPVRLDLQGSLSFSQAGGEGVAQSGTFLLKDRSTSEDLFRYYSREGLISVIESIVLQPGEYTFFTNARAAWGKQPSCDACSGTAEFTFEYTLSFSAP